MAYKRPPKFDREVLEVRHEGPGSYKATGPDGGAWVIVRNELLRGDFKWVGYKQDQRDIVFDPEPTLEWVLYDISIQ